MGAESRVGELLESSREVIQDCILPNGAIVAANSDHNVYPSTALNYRYCWPRDGAFVLYAGHLLNLPLDNDIRHAKWLLERAEGFSLDGSIIKRYTTNGRHDFGTGHEYQPDQAAALLWSFDDSTQESVDYIDPAMKLLASGLAKHWHETHFIHPNYPEVTRVQDVWEEEWIKSDRNGVFVYSLAAAVYGLERAIERFKNNVDIPIEAWIEAHDSMRKAVQSAEKYPYFPWKLPYHPHNRSTDSSLSGLIWPFNVSPDNQAIQIGTINKIHNELYVPGQGVIRYRGDHYDGSHYENDHSQNRPSNCWPLLTFWHAIALHRTGESELALSIYQEQLERLTGRYIPEQIKTDESFPSSPMPLAWAHAKFVIATKELGII